MKSRICKLAVALATIMSVAAIVALNANWGGAMGKFAGTNPWWGAYAQPQCRGNME
jgi:hypothetical protein